MSIVLTPFARTRLFPRQARGNAIRLERYLVEGEYVTTQQMAERLGFTRVQVSHRMRRERKKPGPLTWDGLRS